MRLDPAIAALRRDRAPQRRAQAAMAAACAAWRERPEITTALADFEHYGRGAPPEACPALRELFTSGEGAFSLAAGLIRTLCAALEAAPIGHPTFRHGYDRGRATLLLARSGRAQLVLQAREPGHHRFAAVAFRDGERHEAVLAGKARARIVRRQGRFGRFATRRLALEAGTRLTLDLGEEALQVLEIERPLVSLALERATHAPKPSREYDLASGALLRQAAGDIRTSRSEAMLALLGRMHRAEAAPVMAAIACESGDPSLRWQALRECLALDTAAGFEALSALARAKADPLAEPAAALRTQLVETHPELGAVDPIACLA